MIGILKLLMNRQSSILSGATILMATVFASKFLGLIRDRLLAHAFTPYDLSVFWAAFRVPDFMFQVLIFGAVSVAFIPVFTEHIHHKGEKEAFEMALDVFNAVLLGFTAISILLFIFAGVATDLIVPGFDPSQKALTIQLTRIILLGQILLTVGAFFSGIAQSFQRFFVPAFASVLYNFGIILGILFLSPNYGLYGPAIGVIVGALLYMLVQLPLINSLGFKYRFSLNLASEGLIDLFKMMSMRTVGITVEQINETVGVVLASLASTSSVTFLTFAQHLVTVPIGLFGATLAQAAMPVLSRERAMGEDELFKGTLLTTMHQILFLTLPAAAILIVLRIPAVRLVFGASQFDWPATQLTGQTLAFLSVGLVGQSESLLLMRGFYALKDTKTPVIVSIGSVSVNVILSYWFIKLLSLPVWSLGLAYAVSSNLAIFMLLFLLSKKLGGFSFDKLVIPAAKMLLSAIAAAVALYIPIKALDIVVFNTTRTINLILLTGIASTFGLGVYLLLVWLLQVNELFTFIELLKRIYNVRFQFKTKEMLRESGTM